MKVLVIGSGGREHAIVWRLAQSPSVEQVYASPGNPGMAQAARCVQAGANPDEWLAIAESVGADLTVVGPEAPLVAGVVDAFRAAGRAVVGPTREAAQLEGSKVYAKQFMVRAGIPTAEFVTAETEDYALGALDRFGCPVVLKADGLAAGKGVIVAGTRPEAEAAVHGLLSGQLVGTAGSRLVIEEYVSGEEVSFIVVSDGKNVLPLEPTQDHKAVHDGDTGPNTGGMGAFSPATDIDASDIFERTVAGIGEYRGVLYAGLMLTADGPKVLEFNCRFGDPETQAIVPRMDFDLAEACAQTADGALTMNLKWKRDAAVCVVMAAGGYPGEFKRGVPIEGLKEAAQLANVAVFHAGTKRAPDGRIVTDGGRVLGVTGLGESIEIAARRAYEGVARIRFDGAQVRQDIAARRRGNESRLT
jgi:phosphoribosylamine--glycine ligase